LVAIAELLSSVGPTPSSDAFPAEDSNLLLAGV